MVGVIQGKVLNSLLFYINTKSFKYSFTIEDEVANADLVLGERIFHVRAGEKRFFLTYVNKVDQCSFLTNHKIKLVAFEDGEVLITETHNSWQDNASKPVLRMVLGYIDNPPTHGIRVGRNEICCFIRKINITNEFKFNFQISKKRSIVGAYGIPLVTSISCRYEMSIATLSDYALEINSPGHYGCDEDGYKGVFKRDSL